MANGGSRKRTGPGGSPDAEPAYAGTMRIAAPEYRPTAPRCREDVRTMRLALGSGVLGLLAALSACYAPHAPRGVECSIETKSCPDGQACVNGTCGGNPLEIDAAIDTMPDALIELCPGKPNATQRDEDGDGVGDDCDPCPIDKDNSDPDKDGVGGPCDPNPNTFGDQIVVFQSFQDGIPNTWEMRGNGTMAATDGDVVITNTANNRATLVPPVTEPFGNGMIMAGVVVNQTLNANRIALAVGLPYNPETDVGIQCQLHQPMSNTTAGRELSLFDSKVNQEQAFNAFLWETGVSYRLAMIRTGAAGATPTYKCSVTDKDGAVKGTATASDPNPPARLSVGVTAGGTTAHVAWVLVVSSP
jgi:hypothetical protein